jgi:hypothetical protein
MSDYSMMKLAQVGQIGELVTAGMTSPANVVSAQAQRCIFFGLDNSANSQANQAESPVWQDDVSAGKVISCKITTPINVTASDSNFITFTLATRTANGAATTIATANTAITGGTGNITAFLPVALTLTANAVQYNKGDQLTFKGIVTGSGVALNNANAEGLVTIVIERN